MSKRLISEKELLYVVSYTIEAMNRHFATDGSDEPEPQDIVNEASSTFSQVQFDDKEVFLDGRNRKLQTRVGVLALDENEVSQDTPGGLEHASTVGIEHFNN